MLDVGSLDKRGRESQPERAKLTSAEMREVDLVLPYIVFDGGPMSLHVGNNRHCSYGLSSRPQPGFRIVCLVKV